MLLFIVSNILGSSIQITTLPLVILSPLQASGLVFNSICATLILAEPFTRLSLVGTILVCGGAALIAAFGALKESAHSLDELLELLGKPGFLVWMFGTLLLVAAILIGVKMVTVLSPRTKHVPRVRMGRGIAYGCVRYGRTCSRVSSGWMASDSTAAEYYQLIASSSLRVRWNCWFEQSSTVSISSTVGSLG